tara:strand:- start:93 stop:1235 length:1143 start_codon:yes stop_codon:yes gene_type:complete
MPTIKIGIDFRLDDLLSLFLIPVFFFVKPKFRASRLNFTYSCILILIIISTLHGYYFLNVPISIRDLNEFIRVIKPFLIILIIDYCNLIVLSKYLDKFFKIGAILLILFGFLEYFNILGFRSLIAEIYSNSDRFNDITRSRMVLTSGNPNDAAVLLFYFLTYFTQSLFLKKSISIKLSILFFLIIVLLMTSSRTVFICFVIIILLSLIYHFRKKKFLSLVIFSVCLMTLVSLIQFFDYLTIGFSTFQSGENTSMIIRYQLWDDAFNLFLQSPFFGWGPAKAIHTTVVDGEHFMLLRRYGIFGYFAIIYLLLGYFIVFLRKRKKLFFMGENIKVLAFTSLFTCLIIPVIMVTNNFFSSYQLMPLYVIMIAIVEKSLKYKHD